jgi:hypothetical protein
MSDDLTSHDSGDMATALHAAVADAGLNVNGDPVDDSADDATDEESVDASADSPSANPQEDDPDVSPTEKPTPASQLDTKPKGPIPLDRHEAILKSTRQKVESEVRQNVERELGPWKQVISSFKPDEFAAVADDLRLMAQDPVAFHRKLGAELERLGHLPQPSPAPQRSAPADGGEPQPDLVNETGELVYSDVQHRKLLDYREARMEARIAAKFAPLEQSYQAAQQERHLEGLRTQATQAASEAIAEAQQWEAFEELRPDILALMRSDKRWGLEGAYNRVLQTKYLPTLKARERDRVLADMKRKGQAASSGVSPNSRSNAPVVNGRERSFADALAEATANGLLD